MSDIVEATRVDQEPVGRKLAQVHAAAHRLFLEYGFALTSMDAVAREAGVSKATLYCYFPSKEALFARLIGEECGAMQAKLIMPSLADGLEPALRTLANDYVRLFLTKKKNSLFRVMANESTRFPEMCLHFYETGPMSVTRRVAQFMLDARERNFIAFHDAMTAATQFLNLVRGDLTLRAVLGIAQLTNDNVDAEIEAGLATFLRAYKVA